MSTFVPCWSFCTPDCRLRQYHGCRPFIPRFDLPSPNEGVDHLCYLKYGRQDYEDHPAFRDYDRQKRAWISSGKIGDPPIHWRKVVGDPWAHIYVWEDPEQILPGYNRPMLYDPLLLQEQILECPRIIAAVQAAIENNANYGEMRTLQKAVLSFFRQEFREYWQHPTRTLKFFEHSVELISGCLLLNYELFPEEWARRVILHAQPSPKWLEFLQRVESANRPVIKRLKPEEMKDHSKIAIPLVSYSKISIQQPTVVQPTAVQPTAISIPVIRSAP